MESDLGKLFIGGISWETNEDRLKEYFKTYGEVVEAVIMKDRTTGRARGFGFVVFADPSVADRVVLEKHMIDGRTVEAKKAVPRDDQHTLNRNLSNIHGSASPARTKKVFVGGLASTVTETDFKKYFDQFGTITDVVVMYDHNTQRPRGFGFITYDSEDAVDRVLLKTFHELNGKMVEVKRAVPKELSPGPSRSPLGGFGYGLNRVSNILNGYTQGYNPNSLGGYQMRMDGRFSPLPITRTGYSSFGPPSYGLGANFAPSLSPSYSGSSYSSNLNYNRGLNAYYNGNSSRYNPIGYTGSNGVAGSFFNTSGRNVWSGSGLNSTSSAGSADYATSGSGNFGSSGATWGLSPSTSIQNGGNGSGYTGGILGYENSESSYGLGGSSFVGRSSGNSIFDASYGSTNGGYDGSYADLYGSTKTVYGDPTWMSEASEPDGSNTFDYGLGDSAGDAATKVSERYLAGYNVTNRQSNRGVAA